MNPAIFSIFFKSISKPIINKSNNIPKLDKKENSDEEVIDPNGFLIAKTVPISKEENIPGILNLSKNLPIIKTRIKNPARKINIFTSIK